MCVGGRYIYIGGRYRYTSSPYTHLSPTYINISSPTHIYKRRYLERGKRDRERERKRERTERGERREGERMQRHSCALISVLMIHSFYRAILLPSGRNSPRGCLLQCFEL
jgi:hypothetical protein